MSAAYLRQWSIAIDGEPFIDATTGPQFRCVFDISVMPMNSISFADIRLYNLAKTSAIRQGASVEFRAGYVNNSDVIFVGTVTNVFPEREGPDIATRLMCRSGGAMDDRGSAMEPFGAGTLVVDAIKALASRWPRYLELDETQFSDNPSFPTGWVADGDIPRALDALGHQFGFSWVVERGSIVVTRDGRERVSPLIEVNQFTGMVGMPEVTRGPSGMGIYVVKRLDPSIRSSSRINVTSKYSTFSTGNLYVSENTDEAGAGGIYNVLSLKYSGDTHGDEWNVEIDAIRPGAESARVDMSAALPDTGGQLIWGSRLAQAERAKVREVGKELGMQPNWLMAIMAFETGRSFSPSQPNAAGGSAIGLIQFMEPVISELGYTRSQLAAMTFIQQMDVVRDYFKMRIRTRGKLSTLADAYMAVLWPAAVNKPDDYVLWTKGGQYSRQYDANSGLDRNRDGTITKVEAASRVFDSYKEGLKFMR